VPLMICFRRDRQAVQPAISEKLESRRLLSASPAADALATLLTPLPASVLPGARGIANISVSDSGFGPVNGKAQITLLATTDGTLSGTVATVRAVTEQLHVTPGDFQRFALHFTYPTALPTGSYKFVATVNLGGAVSQTPSSDQGVVIAPAFVNLAAYFEQAPTSVLIGVAPAAPLSLVVNNSGNTVAKGRFTISLFESPTQTLGAGADLLQTFSNEPIRIAADATETLTLTEKKIPLSASTGDQYLIAVLNSTDAIPQAGASTITTDSASPTNFTTDQFTAVPTQPAVGRTVSVSLLVSNADGTPIHGDVDITLSQSATRSLGTAPTPLETFSDRPINIPVGGTQTYTLNLKVPLTATLGYQFLVASLTPIDPLAATRTTDSTVVAQGITAFT